MFSSRSEYDRGVNTFRSSLPRFAPRLPAKSDPNGTSNSNLVLPPSLLPILNVTTVEYAIEAIKLGSTTVGIQTSEGVVLAVEKRTQSPLLDSDSVEKIMEIDSHIGCAMSGLTADARTMVEHARVTAQNHSFTYDEPIKVESVTQAVCDLALRFGEGADEEEATMSRPFGVALLIAGIDENGPQLYSADPSGTFMRYDAKAIGSGSEGAQSELQDSYNKSMTLLEAQVLSLKVLKQVMEEKLDHTNVQLSQVVPGTGFKIMNEAELKEVIARTEAVAPVAPAA